MEDDGENGARQKRPSEHDAKDETSQKRAAVRSETFESQGADASTPHAAPTTYAPSGETSPSKPTHTSRNILASSDLAVGKRAVVPLTHSKSEKYSGATSSADSIFLIKILVPAPVAGSIIGKGGSVVSALNASTGARIKVSQNNEYFPGTQDRVMTISGTKDAIAACVEEVAARIVEGVEKAKSGQPQFDAYGRPIDLSTSSKSQLRLLIPMTASGIIIGRGGSVIKHLSEISGCRMQLADAADPFHTEERIMIINSNDRTTLIRGVQAAIAQLFSDPTVCTYSNTRTSYGAHPPVGVPATTTPLGGMGGLPFKPTYANIGFGDSYTAGSFGGAGAGLGIGIGGLSQLLPSYNAFGAGGGIAAAGAHHGLQPPMYKQTFQHTQPLDQVSLSLGISPPVYTTDGANITMELGIPDAIIGALMGRGGSVVKEIMQITGSTIQISQKDVYVPGTTNRIVKITGTQHQLIGAHAMMMEKLQQQRF